MVLPVACLHLIWGKYGSFLSQKNEEIKQKETSFSALIDSSSFAFWKESDPPPPQRWNHHPIPKRISAYTAVGQSPANATGYYGLQVFIAPQYPTLKVLPLVEANGFYFFDNTYGINLGIGGRYLPSQFPVIFGLNAVGGYYQGRHGPLFQAGAGLELIAERWGLHVNGYLPVAKKTQVSKHVFDQYGDGFKASCTQSESSFKGFNAEGSVLALQKEDFFLYVSGGPYFFVTRKDHIPFWGGQFTVQPQYLDILSLSFSVSHDPFLGTLYQGTLSVSIPLYSFSRLKDYRGYRNYGWINRQIYQPLRRFGPIPSDRMCCWETNF